MSEADTDRRKITVTHKGKATDYYARELGYFEFQDVEAGLDHMPAGTESEKNRRGMALMRAVTVASIERPDGAPAFTSSALSKLHKDVAKPLADAAMLAQGIDMEKIRKEAAEAEANKVEDDVTDEAAAEGNG